MAVLEALKSLDAYPKISLDERDFRNKTIGGAASKCGKFDEQNHIFTLGSLLQFLKNYLHFKCSFFFKESRSNSLYLFSYRDQYDCDGVSVDLRSGELFAAQHNRRSVCRHNT